MIESDNKIARGMEDLIDLFMKAHITEEQFHYRVAVIEGTLSTYEVDRLAREDKQLKFGGNIF